jgi:hypothetical protein
MGGSSEEDSARSNVMRTRVTGSKLAGRAMRTGRRPVKAAVTIVAVLAAFTVLGGTVAAASGPNGSFDWPGMKKCGSFRAQGYRIYVYANHHLSCRKAARVMRAFWGPSRGVVAHNGGAGAFGWYTLKKYPGWKCNSGAGGGSCSHKHSVAGYQN